MKKLLITITTVFAFSLGANGVVMNLEVYNVQAQIAGTTTNVPSSGSPSNYSATTSVGNFAVFDIQAVDDANAGASTDYADLRITYSADNANTGPEIMIARTTDSQGLEDGGTITVLVETGNGGGTVDLTFDWFAPGSFIGGVEQVGASLLNGAINYTTFDIDFSQQVGLASSKLASYTLDANTVLKAEDNGTDITFKDKNADSTFTNPLTAAQFLTTNSLASHTITMGKQSQNGPALFMFEFRNPSDIVTFPNPDTTPVPELRSFGLSVGFLVVFLMSIRRRL